MLNYWHSRPRQFDGGCSSVGRAPDCGSGCRGFDPRHPPIRFFGSGALTIYAFVAQLDRATDFESVGRGFESLRTQECLSTQTNAVFQRAYSPLFRHGPLAQLAEQQTLNLRVEGSNPSRLTILAGIAQW